ncbi:hypothetical protein DMH04_00870 [Kibdelosporangium aridum]|uniref:Uncharacterized protein n=1 Tax=Kibdelosporangium aridum TaxID=2030 RepID=A0A428ZU54_KIBAR|nr:hypothetical protein [Kibdelosporangium aridum]RSM91578.1 hypothetical protein DMH04_00870 [Kibdelosporangium aridum]
MTERPRRPGVLIAALVALPLAALLFGMTASNLGGPGTTHTSLPALALLISLLAIRFSWARTVSVVVMAFLTLQWLPGALEYVDEARTQQPAIYVLIATALFAAGVVLAYMTPSNQYYRQAAEWRQSRKQRAA